MRIGFGYDSHRFVTDDAAPRPLILGGVEFAGERGLVAHSDGDVIAHAIIDALLGAAALGDIGGHFPDTDARWRGADSMTLLAAVVDELAANGYRVGNLDVAVICERPKIGPMVAAIKRRLAEVMHVDESALSIKGKTNEKMDDVGAGRGIEVHAVALLLDA